MTQHELLQPTDAFAELGRIAFDRTPLDEALGRIAELAKRTIPGADEVSVTLQGLGGAHTAAYTGELALLVDEWQYKQGYGPCLAAAVAAITVTVPDTAADGRWPEWPRHAAEAGVHSSVSIGLPVQQSIASALNVYSTAPRAFDEDATILAQTFAGYVAVALCNARRTAEPGVGR
jgi:GAF domain-containing protein